MQMAEIMAALQLVHNESEPATLDKKEANQQPHLHIDPIPRLMQLISMSRKNLSIYPLSSTLEMSQ